MTKYNFKSTNEISSKYEHLKKKLPINSAGYDPKTVDDFIDNITIFLSELEDQLNSAQTALAKLESLQSDNQILWSKLKSVRDCIQKLGKGEYDPKTSFVNNKTLPNLDDIEQELKNEYN